MATTQSYSSLSLSQRVEYAKNVSMANYGVTQPNVTATNNAKLTDLINATTADITGLKQLISSIQLTSGTSPYSYPIPFSSLPTQVQSKLTQFIPPGYSPPANITGQEIIDIEQGVVTALQALQQNPSTIPAAGSTISIQPVPSASSSTFSNILTAAAVIGTGALVVNALTNTVTSPVPAAPTLPAPVPAADNPNPVPDTGVVVTPVRDPYPLNLATTEVAPTVEAKQDPSSSEYTNESDRASDAASQQIANQQDPSSAEYINESDRASDLASQTIQNQKTPAENTPTGPAYDDAGYLMPGWSLNENNEPVWVGDNADGTIFVEPATKLSADTSRNSYTALLKDTQSKATQADANNLQQERDWRVKLSLAKGGKYLYNVDGDAGILGPLKATNGIIFPYTPQINVTYAANYDPTELIHSNYKIFQYKGSSVDQISITCDFTAQDTFEANYLLAVIHFFRSVTKMFYGQDQKPNIGSPPPLCYLSGLGAFQFNNHPLAIASFNYILPNDVDYIRATNTTTIPGVNKSAEKVPDNSTSLQGDRIGAAGLNAKQPAFQQPPAGSVEPTYVPTKMSIQITAYPIVSRNDISNRFSLRDYATGNLLRGKQNTTGGIW